MRERDAVRFEQVLGRVLRVGSIVSTALLAVGLGLALAAPGAGAASMLLSAGLVALMATPVARVVVSVIEYVSERDWAFAAVTAAVLVVLTGSLIVAIRN